MPQAITRLIDDAPAPRHLRTMIESDEITANDLHFHVFRAGRADAPLLLFLHGFPEYSGAWEEMLERLSDEFLCIAPDQRGYGQSAKPEGVKEYATGKLAADAAAILTHYAPKARAVIGHDWGASVAYALSFGRPDLMEKLVILNGAHPIPFRNALAAGGPQSTASQYFHYLRHPEAEERLAANDYAKLERLFAEGMDLSWLAGARRDVYRAAWAAPGALTGMLNWYRATPLQVADSGAPIPADEMIPLDSAKLRVIMPHLLIWGAGDTALLPEATEGLEAFCDDLTRVEIAGADHWLVHQKPDRVAALIREFASG